MPHRLLRQVVLMVLIASSDALVATASAEAQQTAPKTSAGRLTFAAGSVSFVPPPGFTALTADEISVKYPRDGAPRQAVSNARGTTSIAYDLQELRAPSNDLEALRKELLQSFAQMPKLKYMASDVRRIGRRDWAYVEFTMAADDQDIHNIVLLSVQSHGRQRHDHRFRGTLSLGRAAHAAKSQLTSALALLECRGDHA